jgi:hypothetical protein
VKKKYFWTINKNSSITRKITCSGKNIIVNGKSHNTHKWLKNNKELWFEEWLQWSQTVAMNSMGDFHWSNNSEVIAYYDNGEYLDFVQWKKKCYISCAYKVLPDTKPFKFLKSAHKNGNPLGLVHPKGINADAELPLTEEILRNLYDDPSEMACMSYVIAGLLLGVEV